MGGTAKGRLQTEAAHVTERFTRRDSRYLEIDITTDDSKAYVKSWPAKVTVRLLPDTDLIETYDDNQEDQAHKK